MLRGGSWNNNDPRNLLSSNRNHNEPGNRNNNIGFRVVLVGGSVRKVSPGKENHGAMRHGRKGLCRQSQEESPNPAERAPVSGKRRGAGRGR